MSLDQLHQIAENGLKDGLGRLGFDLSHNVLSPDWQQRFQVLIRVAGHGEFVPTPRWPLPGLGCPRRTGILTHTETAQESLHHH